ncbi:hypothetical protein M446_3907 [Methylobacterium sp. 4-46]|uniref:hypothetical protein n=1 Tax=unclassified Methylobacterium TaxID=2615210 RepID=UPI000165C5B4|nr:MULTISPECIES: hypothetical protein [Methylobacterium]ACA18274.1 hypothetical protein M446_3907 [Methylobacterium sp. 4-46]WFT77573.1 hypothetical protein QA634_19855 [Methylobacterium nodulans]
MVLKHSGLIAFAARAALGAAAIVAAADPGIRIAYSDGAVQARVEKAARQTDRVIRARMIEAAQHSELQVGQVTGGDGTSARGRMVVASHAQ